MNLTEVEAIDSHTAGEPTRIVVGGLPEIPGATMADKRSWLREHLDPLRTGLVLEPRGHDAIVLAYLLPPVDPAADIGVIFANDAGYLNMCGHGTIGVVSALVDTGRVPATGPRTRVVLDTPVGLVEADAEVLDGRARSVTMRNVPSFLYEKDVVVQVEGLGAVPVDIAYGGNWFGMVDQKRIDIPIEMANLRPLMDIAGRIRDRLTADGVRGFDPLTGEEQPVDHLEIIAKRDVPQGIGARTLTLCPGVAYDRSPCGTGTSAKLAALHARGELAVGQELHNMSVTGTEFVGSVVAETSVGEHAAVIPQVRGSAYITGHVRFVFDPRDPLVHGFR